MPVAVGLGYSDRNRCFRGLDSQRMYRIDFEDGTHPSSVESGAELTDKGLPVTLNGGELSDLIFFEVAR